MAMRAIPRSVLQVAGRAASRGSCLRGVPVAILAPAQVRHTGSAAAKKVIETLKSELKHEEEQYEQAKEIKNFLSKSEFKLNDTDGDVNMVLERELGEKVVKIEWQLTSPFNPEEGGEGEAEEQGEATDFIVSVENKNDGGGLSFFCSTQTGEDHRYVIGNVKSYANTEEKDSVSSYNGPDFEDIDDKLQEAFDEYLAEVGMNNDVCDFIDATALDKEQREYLRWLKITKSTVE